MTVTMLGPEEAVPHRPFTAVELYDDDLECLAIMLDDLRTLLTESKEGIRSLVPHQQIAWKVDGLMRRAIVCDPERLLLPGEVCVVGFFSQRDRELDIGPLERANSKVVREFKKYPGVLSYSSVQLVSGEWANLVVHDKPDVAERWRASEVHARAVAELSPKHYYNVRIHNGKIAAGLFGAAPLAIERTKYWDYSTPEVWKAVRELS